MKKELTAAELLAYIKEKGELVLAQTTEQFNTVPACKLWFGYSGNSLSTWGGTTCDKNKPFKYIFDYEWTDSWHDSYKGKFIVEMPEEQPDRPKDMLIAKIIGYAEVEVSKIEREGLEISVDALKSNDVISVYYTRKDQREIWTGSINNIFFFEKE